MDGKNEPLRSLGIFNSTSPAWVANKRGRDTIALSDPGVRAFVAISADLLGRFDLDQLLHHQTHRITDEVDSLAGTERVQQLGQDRL